MPDFENAMHDKPEVPLDQSEKIAYEMLADQLEAEQHKVPPPQTRDVHDGQIIRHPIPPGHIAMQGDFDQKP